MDEHDIYGDSGGCSVDCNNMGDFNEDDTGDSQSMAEDSMDDKNLFNPLLIQNAKDNQLMEWDDIQNKIFECYHDYIICDLDPILHLWRKYPHWILTKMLLTILTCLLSLHVRTLIIITDMMIFYS